MANNRKLYDQLGVSQTASQDDIRSAYKKLAREFHPDRNKKAGAEQRFKEVGSAYQVLSDNAKRKRYDEFGELALQSGFDDKQAERVRQQRAYHRQGFAGQGYGQPGFAGQGHGQPGFAGQAADFNLGDLLRGFGGGVGAQAYGSNVGDMQWRSAAATRPRDVHASVELTFVEAAAGAEMVLEVPALHEAAAVRRQRVRIPAGVADGSVLRLRGQGTRLPNVEEAGDLLLTVRVKPHKVFTRNGLDLLMRLPVDLLEAYEGTTLSVPTLNGSVMLRVPPHSQPGAKLRLRGKGVQRGDKRGDLIVELDVRMPDREAPGVSEALRRTRSGYRRPPRADYAASA